MYAGLTAMVVLLTAGVQLRQSGQADTMLAIYALLVVAGVGIRALDSPKPIIGP